LKSTAMNAGAARVAGRGVSVTLRGNRLVIRPDDAYRNLSDAEILTLRHHREAIKQAVRAGTTTTVRPIGWPKEDIETTVSESTTATPHEPTIDRDAELKDRNLEAWRIVHGRDKDAIERRNREATAVMLRTIGLESPYL
jgi:hypothetical protein